MPPQPHFVKAFLAIALFAGACLAPVFGAGEPRVLVLGDSFYQRLAGQVAAALKDRAQVVAPPDEALHTGLAVTLLDQWLGDEKWDLIYFNFGLGDLTYRAPGMKAFRIMSKKAGGVLTTAPVDYERNLIELVKVLKKTGARLVWASTTPVRDNARGIIEPGSEIEYNAIAARVMKAQGIPVFDMHRAVLKLLEEKPAREEPFNFGKNVDVKPLLVQAISEKL